MNKKQCDCCFKVTEKNERYGKFYCTYHRKYLKDINSCEKEFMYNRPSCCETLMEYKIKKGGVFYWCDECKKRSVFKTIDTMTETVDGWRFY